ncbi:DUF2723 domain-containing protein [Maribellus sediminis]|uniref:glycosyltransferase family 117 protein n=1 Tax=Maribellus sediminis TaxID=2696285 RepID=UPI00142FB39F|nr:DUF2723 domain-containing protein [Maribellus sediminis]
MKQHWLIRYSGIGIFLLSLLLYTLTLEPTTSFWDCSEFILSANKLEVNHPAGAPLFMLIGRLFTFLSFGNPEKIAWTINFSSGLFSALTIFLLYQVIVKLVKKFSDNVLIIAGSAALGALTFAVSDSFWFSAVEGEVYALSMFFMILSFWAVLKWEEGFGNQGNEKWILFLALITGLGIGVHLLNLLVLPSVVMIIGFKKKAFSLFRLFLFFGIGVLVLLIVLYVLTPLVMQTLARFDFVFVNQFGLPLHSGALAGVLFFIVLITFLIRYFRKQDKRTAELATLSVALVLIGFSVYAVNIIRSSANPPVNFGRPNNIYSLINYLNREQYPKRPLLYGQNYNSPITGSEERLSKDFLEGKYRDTDLAPTYEYDDKTCTWFPRMYSRENNHINAYKNWVNIKGKRVLVRQANGERETLVVPTFAENVKFFVNYQFAFMFGRYFMWNFVGRQNDRQGRGDVVDGNWLSGIRFIDEARLGPQENLPDWLAKNQARNTYFFLPFLLGLIGAWFHFKKHRPSFFVVLALFIMGGLGLAVYINEVPITPRERDYVFVVAFLAFSIWVGLSFWALAESMKRLPKAKILILPLLIVLLLAAPVLMLWQNFDDHDRSGRTAARDLAMNILESCPPNAILVSSGDNDTYPLLYCQEVENFRTDVRIVIAPFLAANWFIDGLRKQKYNDAGLKMTLPQQKYDRGELDFVPVLDRLNRDTSWQEALNFLKMDSDQAKVRLNSGEKVNFIPLKEMSFSVKAEDSEGKIEVSLKDKNFMYKNELVLWDIISSNALERPICFVSKAEAQKYNLDRNLECEGFAYRLVPEKSNRADILSLGQFDPEKLYSRLLNEYQYGNLADPAVHVDWNSVLNVNLFRGRNVFNEVAASLLKMGEEQKAADLLAKSAAVFPLNKIPYDVFSLRQTQLMVNAGMNEQARQQFDYLENEIIRSLRYFTSIPIDLQQGITSEINNQLYYLNNLTLIATKMGDKEKAEELKKLLEQFAG